MATTVAHLQAVLSANTRDFDQGMDRSQSKMRTVGKAAGIMGGAIFAGLAVVAKRGFDELKESQLTMAQTAAVIKSTGGAANVTAKHVDKMAMRLEKLSAVDDEVIVRGQNMLLTFVNIRNRAGEMNDIFDQTTQLTLDLSVAMGLDMKQAALQVGKALNDPERGMSRLQRIGVTFTQSQKDAVAALMKTGDVAGAQKIILAELQKEFGGSAKAAGETLPGQLAKARNSFDEMAANLVTMLLPALTTLIGHMATAIEWLRKHPTALRAVVIGITALAAALVLASIAQLALNLAFLASPIGLVVLALVGLVAGIVVAYNKSETFRGIVNLLWEKFKQFSGWLIETFGPAMSSLVGFFKDVINWIKDAVNWVKALIKWLGKIEAPSFNVWESLKSGKFKGGPVDPNLTMGYGPASISPSLYDELAGARSMGLVLTSGYRPGAVTRHGTPSDHGVFPSKAIDVAGAPRQMARFFRWLIGQTDVKQAFYDPLGSIFGGALSSYREGGHSDHVHVATYDRGGWLMPGLTLAQNNTGRPEAVGFPGDINLYVDGQKLFSWFRGAEKRWERRNG